MVSKFEEWWSNMVSHVPWEVQPNQAFWLRKAFIAGQREMRERAAEICSCSYPTLRELPLEGEDDA